MTGVNLLWGKLPEEVTYRLSLEFWYRCLKWIEWQPIFVQLFKMISSDPKWQELIYFGWSSLKKWRIGSHWHSNIDASNGLSGNPFLGIFTTFNNSLNHLFLIKKNLSNLSVKFSALCYFSIGKSGLAVEVTLTQEGGKIVILCLPALFYHLTC